ncbi:hypothetical protein GCM10027285_23010 [Oleiagrimonas citrea]|uniref:Amino acid adenylation domain-containing protein n=1 Tax=Oleiagrimonas citrea TaxID=1665687 RepID=A0A846ZE93_9GAMM|nr:non-ribosomal peptide synthetase [Oleiagrimonas citrea]NKZ37386.1 amino acid adenylation domain-containing protein [Oleiagrimonas citrea]
MHIEQLTEELAAEGIYLAVRNGKLVCKTSEGALTPERRRLISERKADFIAFLNQGAGAANSPAPALKKRVSGSSRLSPTQQRLWFVDQLTESSGNYAIPVIHRLNGVLDEGALERALLRVVMRHDSLRTVIAMQEGEPIARVDAADNLSLVAQSLEALNADEQERAVLSRLRQSLVKPFDLSSEIPLRAELFRLAPDAHVLMLVLHHIASDGWSVENLLQELSTLYAAFHEGHADPLPPLPLQYADYAVWQREWLHGERLQKMLAYWREQLAAAPASHSLPLDRPRPARPLREGHSWRHRLSATLHNALRAVSRDCGTTLFMTMQAAFAVLIARWSACDDVLIGTPVANRPRPELTPLIGFFANTLVLRLRLANDMSFTDVLKQAKATALDAYDHQHLPFDMLVEELNPPRSLSLPPVFQIMFSLQDIDENHALDLPGIRTEAIVPDAINAKFDISLSLQEAADGLVVCWDHSRELFDVETIASLGKSFEILLEAVAQDPSQLIQELPLLDQVAEAQVLALTESETRPLEETCLHTLFERQVARQPDAPALIQAGEVWSYAELNRRANRLAHHLNRLGAGPEMPIAVVLERSPALLVGLLAILKSGGTYVPLEPDQPRERLRFLLADSEPRIVLCCNSTRVAIQEAWPNPGTGRPAATLLNVDTDASNWANENEDAPTLAESGTTPDHLAYVIYTSGSTGHPKGVMNTHRAVVNRLFRLQEDYPYSSSDRVLQKTPIGFDVSVREIFSTLLAGACLVQARPDGHKDPTYLIEVIAREKITAISFVPSMLQVFLDHPDLSKCQSLRHIFSGGEALSGSLAKRCREMLPDASLYNFYGPTEAAINVTAWSCPGVPSPSSISPIGYPGGNVCIYILDPMDRPVPRGMGGEIHIGGVQVARGYLGRPELTAERFVPDPFSKLPGARMYRTGDLGRLRSDDTIEYLGRNDFQVKIRGQRIELGEIEAQLRQTPGVENAVVRLHVDDRSSSRLVAYLVPDRSRTNGDAWIEEVRRRLQSQLPSHMLPTAYMELAQLPVTANGKLDITALPHPDDAIHPATAYEAPETPLEQELAVQWEDLLGHGPVGVTANFFDLGGHSLLLTRLHNRVTAEYGIDLALRQLFEAQTVRDQAAIIASLRKGSSSTVDAFLQPRPTGVPTVLSFAQQRLWFIDQMEEVRAVYNIPCALRLKGTLHANALHRALEAIVQRHEVLRTTFVSEKGEARPKLIDDFDLCMPVHDLRELDIAAREEAIRRCLRTETEQPFDLRSDRPFRVQLLHLANEEHVLLLTLHHIAADGWSMSVLLRELAELYEAEVGMKTSALPDLSLQYADYAYWQRQWLRGERLEAQLSYWERQLAELPAVHNLPLDFPRPELQRHRGAIHKQRMPRAIQDGLKQLARSHGATLFMTFQAVFAVLLARWSGDTDIVMGTPIANRRHEGLAPLIGFFVNSLVLRNDLSGNPRFTDVLSAAKVMALDAYQHQDLPFEMLVDRLRPQRSLSHSPLFQVMLALENNADAIVPFGDLEVTDMADGSGTHYAKFDLTLNLRETPKGLEAIWDYNCDLFRSETMVRIADSFVVLLQNILAAPEQRIQELPLIEKGTCSQQRVKGPVRPLPEVVGVHQLIASMARSAPNASAVCREGRCIDYDTLNRRANQIAHALRDLGVRPDRRVAIHTDRSIETVVGILAVLKAGGAYVPLDPAHPPDRLMGMLRDCDADVILTQSHLQEHLTHCETPRLMLDNEACFASFSDADPEVGELERGHLAYVIYTSGSTGVPKGVMIEHGSLLNMVESCRPLLEDDQPIASAWWASFGFDVSVFEILTALAMGGAVHVVPEEIRIDVKAYIQWLCHHQITQAFLAPFIVRRLRDFPDQCIADLSLRRLWTGVEPLQESELHRIQRLLPEALFVNSYGPTEITFYCTHYDQIRDLRRTAPIGRPMANTSIEVLDEAMQPVPDGVVGEVYVIGACVGRGYLNQPERTAERFLRTPCGTRMYKTGDRARWTAEGQLEFRGRQDFQIKLNGVRIELGEIETTLAEHPGVREVAVLVRTDQGEENRKLVAYVVPRANNDLSIDQLREYMGEHLPPYMLPSAYVVMEALPLTVSGKLDARALPAPTLGAFANSAYMPPANDLEQRLVDLWKEVLQLEQVSVTANFFDLGGHSLKAVLLMSRLREEIGKAIPIATLFKAPSIRALAAHIEENRPESDDTLVRLRQGGSLKPLFVFHAAGGDVLCYHPMLRHLDPDIPIYGFHRKELAQQRVPAIHSIERLADEYVSRLLEEQSEGPYYLAGWSSGGLLALEVAARLEARGLDVAAIMLIDSMLAKGTEVPVHLKVRGLEAFAQASPQAACALMREFDPSLPDVTPREDLLPISTSDYFNYMVAANQIGIDFHRPNFRLKACVHYFGCSVNLGSTSQEQRADEIQVLVQKPIIRQSFDANHFSIMEEPCAFELGLAMTATLLRYHKRTQQPFTDTKAPADRSQGTLA